MDELKKAEKHWSSKKPTSFKLRWWQSPTIIRHINTLVCGESIDGFSHGLIKKLKSNSSITLPLKKGVAVGCGTGEKEIDLIKQGVVESFDLYEISQNRINKGNDLLKKHGLQDKVSFFQEDPFKIDKRYDLIHWNNSLHHMFDVYDAVKWSRDRLFAGGLFYMDDFVGANRFQWPDEQLAIASAVRHVYQGTPFIINPNSGQPLNTTIKRPDLQRMIETDPTEAADSERILGAVLHHFPNAEIINTGGLIYHLALSDMLHNFTEGSTELNILLQLDELCIKLGHSHYAVALAIK
jgi:SAM-dependent methyltransferase